MTRAGNRPLFASLRQDRLLFALVGAAVMLLNLLQPLAQASQAAAWTLCISQEVSATGSDKGPGAGWDECPICLAGHHCSAAPPARALPPSEPAFPMPAAISSRLPAPPIEAAPALPGAEKPPSIRAPPLSA